MISKSEVQTINQN